MVGRVRNVIKRDSRKGRRVLDESSGLDEPKQKRLKKGTELLRRYPVTNLVEIEEDNPDTLERHKKGIDNEIEKTKPRDIVLLPLMRSTYGERRMYILHDATSVRDTLTLWARPIGMQLLLLLPRRVIIE